jgi:hypothetical protein
MIAWLNPLALLGLLAVAGPILVHLLRQPRAVRVPFPSLRFVQPSRTVAARMRRIADPWLLLVRVLIVGAAGLALAQPVLLTPARLDTWNSRTARAVVLDTSRSMQAPAIAGAAREQVQVEAGTAFVSTVFEGGDLRTAMARAAAWLDVAPPARRELVLISDFQAGAVPVDATTMVPDVFGLRAIRVGEPAGERSLEGLVRFGSGARQGVRLTTETTAVTWQEDAPGTDGVRFVAGEAAGIHRIVRSVAAAGAPAGDREQPLAIALTTADVQDIVPIAGGWMLDTIARMAQDDELRRAAAASPGTTRLAVDERWFDVARAADGSAIVRAAAAGGELIVQVAAEPGDYLAAAALRSALHARHGRIPAAFGDDEIVRMPAAAIAVLDREAGEVGREVARRVERSDARWLWLAALLLLGLETWMRRPRWSVEAEAARAA